MRANQLRLWFTSMAYVLLCALRRIGLHDTDFAKATCGTIRLKLLKIGAIVRISVRRIKIAMASACPAAQDWGRAAIRLAPPPWLAPRRHDTRRRGATIVRHKPTGPTETRKIHLIMRTAPFGATNLRDYRPAPSKSAYPLRNPSVV